MPKKGNHQSSLHAFFGGGGGGTASAKKKKNEEEDPSKKPNVVVNHQEKENKNATGSGAADDDKKKGGEEPTAGASDNATSATTSTSSPSADTEMSPVDQDKKRSQIQPDSKKKKAKKRRVIEDDSSSDEDNNDGDNEEEEEEGNHDNKKIPPRASAMKTEPKNPDESMKDAPAAADVACKKTSQQKPAATKSTTKNDTSCSSSSSSSSGKPAAMKVNNKSSSSLVKALKKSASGGNSKGTSSSSSLKTDEELVKDLEAVWDRSVDPDLPYSVICQAFSKIEDITGRLQIQEILTSLFRQVILASPDDLCRTLYLASNSVAPAYECVELGIGDSLLLKAITEATGASVNAVKKKYETEGDLGSVAQNCKGKQKTLGGFFAAKNKKKSLSAKQVLTTFREIAKTKGNQSQKWKIDKIKGLLVQAESSETRYIIRGLQGKLRIGLAQSTVIISLAHALALTVPSTVVVDKTNNTDADGDIEIPDEVKQYVSTSTTPEKRMEAAAAIMKKAVSEVPSYDALWDAARIVPLEDMYKNCTLKPGMPVVPMLAKPTKSIKEVLQRLNGLKFTCEYKYDGERAQVHLLPDGRTKVFSRNLLDTSEKYPEVPLFVKEACKDVESFVLDAEVVAFNSKTGQLVPFQILSTRKKTEESAETAKVQVIVQAFDLMYLNGKSLLQKTLAERRELLHQHFFAVPGKFQFAKSVDHEENGDTQVIEEFLDAAVKGQCEGLMVKTLDVNAIYEPSRRSLNWLKLKKDYLDGLGDSVDLVPLGAYHGRGKRTGFYGAYLLACYDEETEEFQSVCKIGTGFSDEDLKNLAESLNKHIIPQKSTQYEVSDQLECDVWFDAVQVWEVKAADLSKSSTHRGAEGKFGEEGRGIGLRFPRFERIRDDKRPDEATTSEQILDMYYAQDTIVGGDGGEGDDDGI